MAWAAGCVGVVGGSVLHMGVPKANENDPRPDASVPDSSGADAQEKDGGGGGGGGGSERGGQGGGRGGALLPWRVAGAATGLALYLVVRCLM